VVTPPPRVGTSLMFAPLLYFSRPISWTPGR